MHRHTVFRLENLPSLELNLISSSISKLLEILASNIIFLRQELHCPLKSLYFKLYLGSHTCSIIFLLNKNWFSTLLDIHELLNQLSFNIFISHFRSQEIDLHTYHMLYHINMMLMIWFSGLFRV